MKIKMNILLVILTFFTFNVNAQKIKKIKKKVHPTSNNTTFEGCVVALASKSGVVYSVNPGYLSTVAKSNQVTVNIKKTGGRAKTTVNIYAGNQLKKRIIFENGDYKTTKQRVLNNVKHKKIKIEIVNQSVGNTFKYTANIIGKDPSLTLYRTAVKGALYGQFEKTVVARIPCTGKTKIIITRTGGRAQGIIKIYAQNRILKEEVLSGFPNKKEFVINTDKPLTIKLKNTSLGDRLLYKIEAYAVQ